MIGREVDDKLEGEQIIVEYRKYRGPVLIRKTGARRFRFVVYGFLKHGCPRSGNNITYLCTSGVGLFSRRKKV